MAFSLEAKRYLAVYGEWKIAEDDAKYEGWATGCMEKMQHLGVGIQLADENLGRRPARFMKDENLAKLDALRAEYDSTGLFRPWAGRIKLEEASSRAVPIPSPLAVDA